MGNRTRETAMGRNRTMRPRIEAAVYRPASTGEKKWRTITTSALVGMNMAREPITVGTRNLAKVPIGRAFRETVAGGRIIASPSAVARRLATPIAASTPVIPNFKPSAARPSRSRLEAFTRRLPAKNLNL